MTPSRVRSPSLGKRSLFPRTLPGYVVVGSLTVKQPYRLLQIPFILGNIICFRASRPWMRAISVISCAPLGKPSHAAQSVSSP